MLFTSSIGVEDGISNFLSYFTLVAFKDRIQYEGKLLQTAQQRTLGETSSDNSISSTRNDLIWNFHLVPE